MIALVDWAYDKSSEQGRILERQSAANFSFRDLAEKIRMTEADKRAIEAFEPWESLGPFNESLDKDSPEFAIVDFLTSWRNRNYGKMAERAVNLMQLSITNDAQPDNRDEAATEKLKVPTFWSTYSDPPRGVLLWPPKHRRIGTNGQGVAITARSTGKHRYGIVSGSGDGKRQDRSRAQDGDARPHRYEGRARAYARGNRDAVSDHRRAKRAVALLLDRGAEVNAKDDKGKTPLATALRSKVKDKDRLAAVIGLLTDAGGV